MNKSTILWISAVTIAFLAGYIQNRTSPTYPVSGTIGIDGQRATYYLKKEHSNDEDYSIIIRTDAEDVLGIVKWRKQSEDQEWQIDTMKLSQGGLQVNIPSQLASTVIEYSVKLVHKNREYFVPNKQNERLKFLGAVPLPIDIHYYLTLFTGLILAVRAGLEFFNKKLRLRLYSIFTLISFFSCAMIFAPVKKAYELGIVDRTVPPISELFNGWLIALVLAWILNLILISYSKMPKNWIRIFSILTIIIFLSQNFFGI